MSVENALTKEEVIPQLWNQYTHEKDYVDGNVFGIRRNHSIVLNREEIGLNIVYGKYVKKAAVQKNKSASEIESEIKDIHKLLFRYVFKIRGSYREEERRIGNYYDDVLKLPLPHEIPGKMAEYCGWLSRKDYFPKEYLDQCFLLAEIHTRLVLIHPFLDGNGRIARAVADKFAVKMGLPPVYDSYPRANKEQQKIYHDAIYLSKKNSDFEPMAVWVKMHLDEIISKIA